MYREIAPWSLLEKMVELLVRNHQPDRPTVEMGHLLITQQRLR